MDAKDVIKNYLDERAAKDKLFAKTYAKNTKSIDECFKYICSEVAKKRKGESCIALSDDEVFGLAVHYYDEDDIKIDNVAASKVSSASTSAKAKKAPRKKTAKTLDEVEEVEFPLFL